VSQQQEIVQEQERNGASPQYPPTELDNLPPGSAIDSDDDTILDMGMSVADSGCDQDVACLLDSRPSSCRASSLGIEADFNSEDDLSLTSDVRTG
jgi:hypothetical protein